MCIKEIDRNKIIHIHVSGQYYTYLLNLRVRKIQHISKSSTIPIAHNNLQFFQSLAITGLEWPSLLLGVASLERDKLRHLSGTKHF